MKDYKQTLNLPRTEFSMRANLPQREPEFLKFWDELNVYQTCLERNKSGPPYLLHDGPPYANGDIHLGHALNKTLKDIVVRSRLMLGYYAPFVPGWDCHGLPVEHQLLKQLGLKKSEIEPLEFRKKAKEYALHYVDVQRKQFKRLGILGSWQNPYLTLDPEYESQILKSLALLVERGYLYKDVKPVNWCINCETALAEAEVEYQERISDSIYVKFKLDESSTLRKEIGLPRETYFIIWTTTPWTLISNVAIALAPEERYLFLKTAQGEVFILAQKLLPELSANLDLNFKSEIASREGRELEEELARHPFLAKSARVVTAGFVSMQEGTGCVHIAPGHGEEDYLLGKEKGLDFFMPLNEKGIFEGVGEFSGLDVWRANHKVLEVLGEKKALLKAERISHSYPHCWRCKNPIIFRATAQWFMSIDANGLRKRLLEEASRVSWFPSTGLHRIQVMLENRPDWCLSRQRYWGVAIPSLRCKLCGNSLLEKEVILKVAEAVREDGSEVWFQKEPGEFLPSDFRCPYCANNQEDKFEKELDILDVWFESGVSHQAVLNERFGLSYPADLYLEGSDQHRGWFQTSLLTAVAINGNAPFRNVLTHGFVVDGEGRKMSKSLGNVISPLEVIEKYGADVLRLWVISRDFSSDLRISHAILSQVVEAYRKIRNTFRFLLSNLYDYHPSQKVAYEELDLVDKWIYLELNLLAEEVIASYQNYDFHTLFRKIYPFMNEKLSAIYLDVLKDRLYTFHPNDFKRRSSQTLLYRLASTLAKLIAPLLPFTAEDVWRHLPVKSEEDSEYESIHLAKLEREKFKLRDPKFLEDFRKLIGLRDLVMKAIELKRGESLIASSLEANVKIKIALDKLYNFLDNYKTILPTLFIVSEVWLEKVKEIDSQAYQLDSGELLQIEVVRSPGKKCARCWNYTSDLGKDLEFEDVCLRCLKVLKQLKDEREIN